MYLHCFNYRVSSRPVPSVMAASGTAASAASPVLWFLIGRLLLAWRPPQFLLLLHMQHAHPSAQVGICFVTHSKMCNIQNILFQLNLNLCSFFS